MDTHLELPPSPKVSLFVRRVLVFESRGEQQKTVLPFYADGYPGLMFQKTASGLCVLPHDKKMPPLFLYGQTLQPVRLHLEGDYSLVVFQLYPFVIRHFFSLDPGGLNDGCFDLQALKTPGVNSLVRKLGQSEGHQACIQAMDSFLFSLFESKKASLDFSVRHAIEAILAGKGQEPIQAIRENLPLTARTFERRFVGEVGVSPKQFAKIIQFQASLADIGGKTYTKLTDVVYKNGYADQSHFIRVFKAFTGKTPKKFIAGQD